jgi:parallel beta-helix repeat protein
MQRFALVAALLLAGCSAHGSGTPIVPAAPADVTAQVLDAPGSGFVVRNLRDSGVGSLRDAIERANMRQGSNAHITFSVRGVIRLASDLPKILTRVSIDGTTAPNYSKAPVVEVDANDHAAFVFASASAKSKLLALSIVGASGNGVTLEAGSIYLNLNYIGLDLKGAPDGNAGDGVYAAKQSAGNRIGQNLTGASGVVGNIISANSGDGIHLQGSSDNVIADNWIGTDDKGKSAIGNGINGIWLASGSNDNQLGGTRYKDSATGDVNNPTGDKGKNPGVFVVPPDGNLVSGNNEDGIRIDTGSRDNVLNGNFVGTTQDGDGAIGNGEDGVDINGAPKNSLIGCRFVQNPFVYYNVLAGNKGNGLHVTSSDDVTIQANFFGAGANNATVVANGGDGILIDGSSRNTTVGGVIPLGNVSAGNIKNGIEVTGTASGFITFNTFGGLFAFKGAGPNGNDGVLITSTGGNQTVRTNVLSGNIKNGLEIGGDASGVLVGPNIIGLVTKGDGLLPNGGDGVRLDGTAHNNSIGDYYVSVIPQNTFSGNLGYGLDIFQGAHDNQVFNNFIGTDVFGSAALANQKGGIFVGKYASHNYIGGKSDDRRKPRKNIVSGNNSNGILLGNGSSYTSIIDNWIGLNRGGGSLPNAGKPIVEKPQSVHNQIRGNETN